LRPEKVNSSIAAAWWHSGGQELVLCKNLELGESGFQKLEHFDLFVSLQIQFKIRVWSNAAGSSHASVVSAKVVA
jgi:hypothetical protein